MTALIPVNIPAALKARFCVSFCLQNGPCRSMRGHGKPVTPKNSGTGRSSVRKSPEYSILSSRGTVDDCFKGHAKKQRRQAAPHDECFFPKARTHRVIHAKFHGYPAKNQRQQNQHHGRIKTRKCRGIRVGKGREQRTTSCDQPDFITVPYRTNGGNQRILFFFVSSRNGRKTARPRSNPSKSVSSSNIKISTNHRVENSGYLPSRFSHCDQQCPFCYNAAGPCLMILTSSRINITNKADRPA